MIDFEVRGEGHLSCRGVRSRLIRCGGCCAASATSASTTASASGCRRRSCASSCVGRNRGRVESAARPEIERPAITREDHAAAAAAEASARAASSAFASPAS